MAVGGCLKVSVEICEILVCVPGGAIPGFYTRLRFALLASSWLPIPLGIALWRALHVVMLVGGPVCWALKIVIVWLPLTVFTILWLVIIFGLLNGLCAVLSVAVDLVLFVGRSVRFCWSVVGFLACRAPIVKWRGRSWWTLDLYAEVKGDVSRYFQYECGVEVPVCFRGSYYREFKDQRWKTWTRWWEEEVHSREAIAL